MIGKLGDEAAEEDTIVTCVTSILLPGMSSHQ